MQYSDYIASDNARREREVQLANQYNQKPESQRVQNLWMQSVEKHNLSSIDYGELAGIVGSLIIIGLFIFLSIWL